MKEEHIIYKSRLQSFQMTILVIQVFLMVIGGCVFGLGVATRPILRITKPEFFFHVEWILDMMVATGLSQLVTAGLDCFAACWKLIWPIYLGIGLTAMTIFLELGAIGTSLDLLHQADTMANEDTVHAWYWVECQDTFSCHDAMLNYIYHFVLPQIALTSVAAFLQCLGIMYLGRMVRTISEHTKTTNNYREWYREHMEYPDPKPKTSALKEKESIELAEEDFDDQEQSDEVVDFEENPSAENDAENHTPSSILKTDHGYVAASGASLVDFDDSYMMRNRSVQKEKVTHTKSISFNSVVQVHYNEDRTDDSEL